MALRVSLSLRPSWKQHFSYPSSTPSSKTNRDTLSFGWLPSPKVLPLLHKKGEIKKQLESPVCWHTSVTPALRSSRQSATVSSSSQCELNKTLF